MSLLSSIRLWYVTTFARPVKEVGEEKGVTKLILSLLKPDDVVIEVGARVGNATLKLAKHTRFVHAIEADPKNFRMLRAYTRRMRNVKPYCFAAWKEDGTGRLMVSDNDVFSGVSSLKGIQNKRYVGTEGVPLRALDSMEFEPAPTVLLTDCEGAEPEVLLGSTKTLTQVDRTVVETHITRDGLNTLPSVKEILSARGFHNFTMGKWVASAKQEADLQRITAIFG